MILRTLRSVRMTLAVIGTASLIWTSAALANPACPSNSMVCGQTITSNDSAKSCTDSYSTSTYDLIRGSFHVDAAGRCGGACATSASLSAADLYRVGGLPPGTPVTFTAELTVELAAWGTCGYLTPGTASASLREGDSNQASRSIETPRVCTVQGCCVETQNVYVPLRVTVTRLSGEELMLHFDLACSSNQLALVDGILRFHGFPSGASVVSCQGYRADFLGTPTHPVSWGTIKLRYR